MSIGSTVTRTVTSWQCKLTSGKLQRWDVFIFHIAMKQERGASVGCCLLFCHCLMAVSCCCNLLSIRVPLPAHFTFILRRHCRRCLIEVLRLSNMRLSVNLVFALLNSRLLSLRRLSFIKAYLLEVDVFRGGYTQVVIML